MDYSLGIGHLMPTDTNKDLVKVVFKSQYLGSIWTVSHRENFHKKFSPISHSLSQTFKFLQFSIHFHKNQYNFFLEKNSPNTY